MVQLRVSLTVLAALATCSRAQEDALVPDACKQQPKRGRGGSRYDTWYYDVITDDCRWMAARSRFGNANRFVSRAACLAHCKYQINDPCEAIFCGFGARCKVQNWQRCNSQNNYGDQCPPNYAVCEQVNSRSNFRIPPTPKEDLYNWFVPNRCQAELNSHMKASNRTEATPRLMLRYNNRDKKCKAIYVYPPAAAYLEGQSADRALSALVDSKNAFYSIEQCMSTCAE